MLYRVTEEKATCIPALLEYHLRKQLNIERPTMRIRSPQVVKRKEYSALYPFMLDSLNTVMIKMAEQVGGIGDGCIRGFGGSIEPPETPAMCAARETHEESEAEVTPVNMTKSAELICHNVYKNGRPWIAFVNVFFTNKWVNDFTSTWEMRSPTWYRITNLPYDRLMPGDRIWLPILTASIIAGRKYRIEVFYTYGQKKLRMPVMISEVESFDT